MQQLFRKSHPSVSSGPSTDKHAQFCNARDPKKQLVFLHTKDQQLFVYKKFSCLFINASEKAILGH